MLAWPPLDILSSVHSLLLSQSAPSASHTALACHGSVGGPAKCGRTRGWPLIPLSVPQENLGPDRVVALWGQERGHFLLGNWKAALC